jgi:transcriptional regulator with XRE-family HTH domain
MGYSQKKVARMLRLTDTSTISKWEHGICYPSLLQVFRLARIYHTLPHELFAELWLYTGSDKVLLGSDAHPFISNASFYL